LRQRVGLEPGERVAIVAKKSPDYLELMYAIWHAGLAAVPANAKLHGRELAYILEHSGARICFASYGLDDEIAPHAARPDDPRTPDHSSAAPIMRLCLPPIRSRSGRAGATISPGCSTPPGPPAGPKAPC
jgi:non-ribosomal peptide synthetase component F